MLRRVFMLAALIAPPTFPALQGLAAEAGGKFALRSTDIAPDSTIGDVHVYRGFGCNGGNRSPALAWSNAPAGTKSFAITVFDPDAPTGSGWWHWVAIDIPPGVTSLPTGAGDASGHAMPKGVVQMRTDFGTREYGGPCPPQGDKPHRYVFTVHALRVERLDVPADASAAAVGAMIDANQIDRAGFTAVYGR